MEFPDRCDKTRINMSKIHDCNRNSSPMILIGTQIMSNGILVKLGKRLGKLLGLIIP